MNNHGAITVTQVRNLEPGDLFAHEFLGSVISARVLSVRFYAYQLTDAELEYMVKKGLDLDGSEYQVLGGASQALVFMQETGRRGSVVYDEMDHSYLDLNLNVAVFSTK